MDLLSLPLDTRPRYRVEQPHPTVTVVRMDEDVSAGWEQWFLLRSDAHHDSLHADHRLEKRHLDEAVRRGAGIIDCGDLFCAMQGKWDRRADQEHMRHELRGNNYVDALVRYNTEFYRPYAHHFIQVSMGNHEAAILRHHQTNLTERFAERLNAIEGSNIVVGSYAGWVRFRTALRRKKRKTFNLKYHHGYGGGGPVTKGTIQANRMATYLPDADIVVTGHVHEDWQITYCRDRISDRDVPYIDEQVHIKLAGYKEEYLCGNGYHIEGGRPPKPNGAAWLRFYVRDDRIQFEVLRAK